MPIYEYACRKCSHTLDVLQKMNDEPLVECPACGEPQLRRLISAPRFRLKGKGWYETDFKKDNQRNVHKKDDDAPVKDKNKDKGEGKKDGASESKPEKPAEKSTAKEKSPAKPAAAAD
jgi:putative FmdB family regulatory protein